MKHNLKKILQKCVSQKVDYVLLHYGFIENCKLTKTEREVLQKFLEEMKGSNLVIVFDSIAFTPYNGGYVTAGIKFNTVENW